MRSKVPVGQMSAVRPACFSNPHCSSGRAANGTSSGDPRTLIFAALAALAAGVLTGLAPAFQLGSVNLTSDLKTGAREGTFHRSKLRVGLLVRGPGVPKGKVVVLGLVSTKGPELEKLDDLKRRIDEATKFIPLDQLAISPQCGFASDIVGNRINIDEQKRKLERVVETARQVWG